MKKKAVIEANSSGSHKNKTDDIYWSWTQFLMCKEHSLYISLVAASVSIFYDINYMIIRKANCAG